jgi:hypothetical protein
MSTPDAPAAAPAAGSAAPAGGPPAGGPPAEPPRGGPAAPAPGGQPAGDGQPDGPSDPTAAPETYGVGSGNAAVEAVSRHGLGSLRNEYLREADRLTGEGDADGRDRNVLLIGQVKMVRLSRLSRRQVEPLRHAFVEPGELGGIRLAFEKSRAIILRGPAGYGKQALATRMLIDLCQGPRFQLDSAVDLTELAESIGTDLRGRRRIEQGAGFLLNQPSNFGSLRASVLQLLDDALDKADAQLVLTIDATERLPDDDLSDYIVNVEAVPRYQEIVASHLRYRLSPEQAGLLLARGDVRKEIDDQLAAGPSCKLAADLAEAIAAAADDADDEDGFDIEQVKKRNEQRGVESFDTWFAGLSDTSTRSFAVALGVLNGLPYDAVAKAARALYRAFEHPSYLVMASADDSRPKELRPFRMSRGEWLRKLRAQIKETEVQGAYGRSITEAVEYKDPEYRDKVIRRAWSDYEAQDALVTWLGKLAQDDTEQVRIFAGTALGRLATKSFDFLSYHVLERWASGNVREQREAVAYALRVVAASPRLRANARQLISAWYNSGDPLAQATAARAYGVAYGPIDPAEAFKYLDRLCRVDDIRVAIAIGDSVADLLETGTDQLAESILSRLADSSGEQESGAAAQMVFLIAADGLIHWEREVADQDPVPWPFLLHLTKRLPGTRTAVVRLWRAVLNGALFIQEAQQVMSRWAAAAEANPAVRREFLRLARAIARSDRRCLLILERYCAIWSSADSLNPLSVVSSDLEAILTAEKECR